MKPIRVEGLTVVIPVFNEQDNIAPLAKEVIAALDKVIPFEVIFVDDGSRDKTIARILEQKRQDIHIRLIRHKKNAGQSAALITGAKAARYPWVATMDGDGQNDPKDLLQFIAAVEKSNASFLSSVYLGRRAKRQDTKIRKISSKIANSVRSYILKDNCPDTGCGLKMFPKALFLSLPLFKNCHRFLPALFRQIGAKIIMIPVNHRHRIRGESKYGIHNRLWVGLVDLIGVAWLLKRSPYVDAEE